MAPALLLRLTRHPEPFGVFCHPAWLSDLFILVIIPGAHLPDCGGSSSTACSSSAMAVRHRAPQVWQHAHQCLTVPLLIGFLILLTIHPRSTGKEPTHFPRDKVLYVLSRPTVVVGIRLKAHGQKMQVITAREAMPPATTLPQACLSARVGGCPPATGCRAWAGKT